MSALAFRFACSDGSLLDFAPTRLQELAIRGSPESLRALARVLDEAAAIHERRDPSRGSFTFRTFVVNGHPGVMVRAAPEPDPG